MTLGFGRPCGTWIDFGAGSPPVNWRATFGRPCGTSPFLGDGFALRCRATSGLAAGLRPTPASHTCIGAFGVSVCAGCSHAAPSPFSAHVAAADGRVSCFTIHTTAGRTTHADRQHPEPYRKHALGAAEGRAHLRQGGVPQPRREHQGPRGAGDDRGRGARPASSRPTRSSSSPPPATPGSAWRWWGGSRATRCASSCRRG